MTVYKEGWISYTLKQQGPVQIGKGCTTGSLGKRLDGTWFFRVLDLGALLVQTLRFIKKLRSREN